MTAWLTATRRRLALEAGFGLIEVLASVLVVAIVSGAVLTGLEAANRASGRAKTGSVASTLAQNDQERLRILDLQTLSNLDQSTTTTSCDDTGKACVPYTITSKANWVSDSSGTQTCGPDAQVSYLKLTSTVTWPDMRGSKPAVAESVLAPPAGAFSSTQGSLAVQIVGADGVTGVPGVAVNLAGPSPQSGVTNAQGCVLWGYLTAGNGYTVSFNQSGYVNTQGVTAVSQPASVVAEAVTTKTFLYDKAASANVSFFAQVPLSSTVTKTYTNQQTDRLTVTHQSMSSPVIWGTVGSPVASMPIGPLFPFTTKARAFAGDCDGEDPYKQTPAETNLGYLPLMAPGATNVAAPIQLPAFDVKVVASPGGGFTTVGTPKFKAVPTTAGCANPTWTSAAAMTPTAVSTASDDGGRPVAPGFPYGTYTVCAEATFNKTSTGVKSTFRQMFTNQQLAALPGAKVNGGTITIGSAATSTNVQKDCSVT
jgi:type II secretory pathway pseudopilin PulG